MESFHQGCLKLKVDEGCPLASIQQYYRGESQAHKERFCRTGQHGHEFKVSVKDLKEVKKQNRNQKFNLQLSNFYTKSKKESRFYLSV